MSEDYNLPASTAGMVNDHIARCKNLSLILDKYPPARVIQDTKEKGLWLQDLIQENHRDVAMAQSVYQRWHAMMSALDATLFNAALDWRLVVGLGGESVLETHLTLHRLYGLPFIPASALKGLTRAYLTGEIEEYKSSKEETDHKDVKRIFGSQNQAGTVRFFDALPHNGKITFAIDIMNPHYPDYYGGDKPPANDQNPIPVTFLTVADTTFTFALAPRDASKEQHVKDAANVKTWLLEALQKYGIGGKTSAGYGYFNGVQRVSGGPADQGQSASQPAEHIRPKIPPFREGQEIPGLVISPTDDLRRIAPADTRAFLSYRSFATRDVLLVVSAEEAQNWRPGDTRICVFQREETRDGCSVLICQPRVKKDKKK